MLQQTVTCHLKSRLLGAAAENTSAAHTWERRAPTAAGLFFQIETEACLKLCISLCLEL